ncbi:hypothetical protein E6C70_15830 [Glaciibacter flavus]|uniref:Uncharacterized protein n=1 Tax=Orlajensenia flava TaxID=2565934 RepID=A0A4S4FIT0_9MICO|nr:hypothetical protein [Glaciibacter flavus]THG29085.1 hypothetical protein E6C70_15830 [Glaciibacter flavus]
MVIGGGAVTVRDGSNAVLATFHYDHDAQEAIAYLQALFGPANETGSAGGYESPPATYYDWGGFRLTDQSIGGSDPYWPDFYLQVTVESLDGVHIEAVGGPAIGWPTTKVESMFPDDVAHLSSGTPGIETSWVRVDPVPAAPIAGTDTTGWNLAVAVISDASDSVTKLWAPLANYGV